jgi:biotin-(acetyl-CoA carboxylase) ligase
VLDLFARTGFQGLRPRFDGWFRMRGESVRVQEPGGASHTGRVLGIDADGALRLACSGGERRLLAGEVTLSAEEGESAGVGQ